jgi:hypothetical protein
MPPATDWGWNPQLLAAGSAYATYSAEATKVRKAMADRLPLSRTAPGRIREMMRDVGSTYFHQAHQLLSVLMEL